MNGILYSADLTTMEGVGFTAKEIDIIVSVEAGKEKISDIESFLGISRSVVDHHLSNIIIKLKDSEKLSQQARMRTLSKQKKILEFLRGSEATHTHLRKKHYLDLCVLHLFHKTLQSVAVQSTKKPSVFIKNQNGDLKRHVHFLKSFLSKGGVTCNPSQEKDIDFDLKILESMKKSEEDSSFCISISPHSKKTQTPSNRLISFQSTTDYEAALDLIFQIFPNSNLTNLKSDFQKKRKAILNLSLKKPQNIQKRNLKTLVGSVFLLLFFWIFLKQDWFFIHKSSMAHAIDISKGKEIKTTKHIPTEWNLPRLDIQFVGRQDLLKELHTKLHSKNTNNLTHKTAIKACAGLGGIGKTQLALYYAHNTSHPYTLKAWFPAEDTEALREKYQEFGAMLGCQESKLENVINYVNQWLLDNPGWLLVFDNVNNYEEIKPYLPSKGGFVIITTRRRNWPTDFEVLPIDVMSEEESIQTIKTYIPQRQIASETALRELSKTLGYLPLALVQSAAYMRQNNVTPKRYLNLYKKYEIELLSDNHMPEGSKISPVTVTWNISFQGIVDECKKKSRNAHSVRTFDSLCVSDTR